MVVVKIIGGLGNQMFQYAFIRKLSILKNIPVKMDIFWYVDIEFGKDSKREYSLNRFNVHEDIATREDVAQFMDKRGLMHKIARKFKRDILKIDDFSFNKNNFSISDDSYLEGYWQSEKYFIDIRDILLEEFTLKNDLSDQAREIEKQEVDSNSISLHVRRGDYVADKNAMNNIGACSLDHYREAINIIKGKVPSPAFFVYSDDINWVKENLKIDAPTVYVSRPELRDHEELVLMSKCKHNIIANSSFSWWGAWLNQNPEKIVIAPKQWFKNPNINTKDVIPESWIKI